MSPTRTPRPEQRLEPPGHRSARWRRAPFVLRAAIALLLFATTTTTSIVVGPIAPVDAGLVEQDSEPEQLVDRGNFRTLCEFSHLSYDNPLTAPGVDEGSPYLLMYFGNRAVDQSTTPAGLPLRGDSTCQGHELNRSLYAIPAVFDSNGRVRVPTINNFYYKSADIDPSTVIPFPAGLEMMAGDPDTTSPQSNLRFQWFCESWDLIDADSFSRTIPNCAGDDTLRMLIYFPNCMVDLGTLSSSDLRSHMAYGVWSGEGRTCPESHPVPVPEITYSFNWETDDATDGWYLSSDRVGGQQRPGGSTIHGFWMNGWGPNTPAFCIENRLDCDNGNLGQGIRLDERDFYTGPVVLEPPERGTTPPDPEPEPPAPEPDPEPEPEPPSPEPEPEPETPTCDGIPATIVGTDGDDDIRGTRGRDVIVAGEGDDTVRGLGGDDLICGGPGNDRLLGHRGDDVLNGGTGDDVLVGHRGDDLLFGEEGNDRLAGRGDWDTCNGGPGTDRLLRNHGCERELDM